MGGDGDGVSHDCYATFNRWRGERSVSVYRDGSGWDGGWSFAGVPKLSSFLTP